MDCLGDAGERIAGAAFRRKLPVVIAAQLCHRRPGELVWCEYG